jgi:hypothetical protein
MSMNKRTLHDIGVTYGTDKSRHMHCGQSYLHIYQNYFEPFRDMELNFLELGVKGGHSLRTWKNYFQKSNIWGVDNNPNCKSHEEEQINVLVCEQHSEQILDTSREIGGFDIILDDASHINTLSAASFNLLFPSLKKGGFYIIEDLGNSYLDLSNYVQFWDGELQRNKNNGVDLNHDRQTLNDLFLSLIERMDKGDEDIHYVHFWSRIIIVKKGN